MSETIERQSLSEKIIEEKSSLEEANAHEEHTHKTSPADEKSNEEDEELTLAIIPTEDAEELRHEKDSTDEAIREVT